MQCVYTRSEWKVPARYSLQPDLSHISSATDSSDALPAGFRALQHAVPRQTQGFRDKSWVYLKDTARLPGPEMAVPYKTTAVKFKQHPASNRELPLHTIKMVDKVSEMKE